MAVQEYFLQLVVLIQRMLVVVEVPQQLREVVEQVEQVVVEMVVQMHPAHLVQMRKQELMEDLSQAVVAVVRTLPDHWEQLYWAVRVAQV
jgi:dGTP triphosphohydrolase